MKITILGDPYVKKSNQRVQMRGGRPVKVNTPRYNEWARSCQIQLLQYPKPSSPIFVPINLKCNFFKRTKGAVDLSALYEGIQDELVKAGWLLDDNYKIVASHDGSGVDVDPENPRMEITITVKDKRVTRSDDFLGFTGPRARKDQSVF